MPRAALLWAASAPCACGLSPSGTSLGPGFSHLIHPLTAFMLQQRGQPAAADGAAVARSRPCLGIGLATGRPPAGCCQLSATRLHRVGRVLPDPAARGHRQALTCACEGLPAGFCCTRLD